MDKKLPYQEICNTFLKEFSIVVFQLYRLRVMTVNALIDRRQSSDKSIVYTENDITLDPLIVLRCDERVFRSGQAALLPSLPAPLPSLPPLPPSPSPPGSHLIRA